MSEKVSELIDRLLDRENEMQPPAATFKGIHDYDEEWDDPGPEGIAAYEAFVDEYSAQVEEAARAAEGEDAVDLALARARLANYDVSLRLMDELRRNPIGVPATVVQTIFVMLVRDYAPLEERLGAILARMQKVPAYCEKGKRAFEKPIAKFLELAAELAAQGGPFLARVVPAAAEQAGSKYAADLAEAGERAAAALDDFITHVRGLPVREDFAAGRKITCPLLLLWGATGGVGRNHKSMEIWPRYASDIRAGKALPCGHYLSDEAPEETYRELREFFAAAEPGKA